MNFNISMISENYPDEALEDGHVYVTGSAKTLYGHASLTHF